MKIDLEPKFNVIEENGNKYLDVENIVTRSITRYYLRVEEEMVKNLSIEQLNKIISLCQKEMLRR